MNHYLSPVVLSAGASSRMGRPKALLDLGGRLALDRILDTCALAGFAEAVVVLGAASEEITAGCDLKRARTVVNADWERGMTTSVQCGVRAIPDFAEGFLVWPVDVPLVPAATARELGLRFWILRQNRRNPIVVPKAGRRGHPVLFDRSYAAEILALRDSEPPRAILERHPEAVEEIEAGEEVVRDLDTPEDLDAARKSLGGLHS
ncbi:MAG: nucleotidyltransferase family protein [Planctomycetes bacterium]|nr:nucleotidyltransferase family protein [Planctomycetota bacterium]